MDVLDKLRGEMVREEPVRFFEHKHFGRRLKCVPLFLSCFHLASTFVVLLHTLHAH